MKKTILMIALTLMVFGCKKAQELISNVKNKLIEGYWADMNGLVVEFKNNEGKVVEYGTSRLRNHTNLFNKNTSIYIKNISRTSANSWTADITVGVYVNNDCVGLKYEKTSIEMVDSNGTENLKFSNADFNSLIFGKKPLSYVPPVIISACDTSSKVYQNQDNILAIKDIVNSVYNNIEVRSFYSKPLYGSGCNYVFKTYNTEYPKGTVGAAETEITFGDRPTANKAYKVVNMKNEYYRLESGEVGIKYLNNYYSVGLEGEQLFVTADGGKIRMKADTLEVKNLTYKSKISIDLSGY